MLAIILFATLFGLSLGASEAQSCVRDADCEIDWECKHGFCTDTKLVTIAGDCKDPNEDWLECARTCNPTCADPEPKCGMDCSHSGCVCRKNYVRSTAGQCIRRSDCPKSKPASNDHCTFDSQCPSGFACGHGFCSPLPQSSKGSGSQGCSTTRDCSSREFCRARKCARQGQQDGRHGDECGSSSDCESPLNCQRGVCQSFSASHSSTSSSSVIGSIGSMREVFPGGMHLRRRSGEEIYPEMLDGSLVALFFSNAWSPAGHLFYNQFVKLFQDFRKQGKHLEVVYIGVEDESESDYKKFIDQFPSDWITLPYRWERTREVMEKFHIKGLPHVPLYSKGRIVVDDIREDVHRYEFAAETAETVYKKWKSL